MDPLKKIFRFFEILFWIISLILTVLSSIMTVYQMHALFLPYWSYRIKELFFGSSGPYTFPPYFYRVYGEEITSLNYEHYGYLISAVIVTYFVAFKILVNHPWTTSTKLATKIE